MSIKINEKIIVIPPFLSTTWSEIKSLKMSESILVVRLKDDSSINIPNLNEDQIEKIFGFHAQYLESPQENENRTTVPTFHEKQLIDKILSNSESGVHIAFSAIDGMGGAIEHNPEQSNAPDLPPEMLEKIGAITKIIAPQIEGSLPNAQANCNCFYCQLARVINPSKNEIEVVEEQIPDSDLHFQQWDIQQIGDKLYSVINRLDGTEKYTVFLGNPVGCNCGKSGCDHILAVLKS